MYDLLPTQAQASQLDMELLAKPAPMAEHAQHQVQEPESDEDVEELDDEEEWQASPSDKSARRKRKEIAGGEQMRKKPCIDWLNNPQGVLQVEANLRDVGVELPTGLTSEYYISASSKRKEVRFRLDGDLIAGKGSCKISSAKGVADWILAKKKKADGMRKNSEDS